MKTLMRLAAVMFLMAGCAFAQGTPKADVSAGYSFLRLGGSGGVNQQGGTVAITRNFNDWIGIVGDFGAYHSSPLGVSLNTYTFLAGPRFTANRKGTASPFAEVLVGGAHLTASVAGLSNGATAFAIGAGGGVDLRISRNVALRPQIDYLALRSGGETLNALRGSFSLVIRFGGR